MTASRWSRPAANSCCAANADRLAPARGECALRSLRGRLITLLALLVTAAIAAGMLMLALFRQSATAQIGQAAAEIGRACDAIAASYRPYTAGWQGPAAAGEG